MPDDVTVYTIGHSVQPQEALVDSLLRASIELLVDVRQYPASRRNPQFNAEALARTLPEHGIEYRHMRVLGGRREPSPDSTNLALRNDQFRGYADYMATPEFDAGIEALIELAQERRTAVMCAEAVPWRCHRSLLADALLARGVAVEHLIGASEPRPHTLSPHARIEAGRVTYPALL